MKDAGLEGFLLQSWSLLRHVSLELSPLPTHTLTLAFCYAADGLTGNKLLSPCAWCAPARLYDICFVKKGSVMGQAILVNQTAFQPPNHRKPLGDRRSLPYRVALDVLSRMHLQESDGRAAMPEISAIPLSRLTQTLLLIWHMSSSCWFEIGPEGTAS